MTAALAALAALAAATLYPAAAAALRRRGDAWPRARDASFTAGCAALAWAALARPDLGTAGGPFTAHMATHLALGMVAPLLLVLARPLTLALRALPPGRTRRGLVALAHARPAAWAALPPVAAVLDMGGLWLLYRTELLALTHHRPLAHAAVHVHVFAAGLLFTFAVCQLDPVRRRWSVPARGAVLLLAGAAHSVLAKSLYAAAPPGTSYAGADLRAGAQLMYYGGDLVLLALATTLATQWYTAKPRPRARHHRRGVPAPQETPSRRARVSRRRPFAGGLSRP